MVSLHLPLVGSGLSTLTTCRRWSQCLCFCLSFFLFYSPLLSSGVNIIFSRDSRVEQGRVNTTQSTWRERGDERTNYFFLIGRERQTDRQTDRQNHPLQLGGLKCQNKLCLLTPASFHFHNYNFPRRLCSADEKRQAVWKSAEFRRRHVCVNCAV